MGRGWRAKKFAGVKGIAPLWRDWRLLAGVPEFAPMGRGWRPKKLAGAKGIEPLLVVLETTVLPLNDAPWCPR